MIIGAIRGKTYPMSKYLNVAIIVTGVAMFMGGGSKSTASEADLEKTGPMMWFGVLLLFVSLCFDGLTGVYEDELMQAGHLGPFELMYNIQFGKMMLAFCGLLFNNEINFFFQLVAGRCFIYIFEGLDVYLPMTFFS
jgi:solute carrier family 35 (UDP-galactose transporter), member B1